MIASQAVGGASTKAACGRGPARERAICDAALQLLAEVGYDRMSMDDVAARARASKATIYRHWSGKPELVLDAVRSRTPQDLLPADTGSLRGDLIATLRRSVDTIAAQDADLVAGTLAAMRSAPDLADCLRSQLFDDKLAAAGVVVDRGVSRGELPAATDAALLHEVAAALLYFRLLVSGQPLDDSYLEHVVDDVLLPLLTPR